MTIWRGFGYKLLTLPQRYIPESGQPILQSLRWRIMLTETVMISISLWVISGLRYTELFQRQKVPPRGLSEWVDQTRETKLLQLVGLECLF